MPSSTRAAAKACLDVLRRTDPREVEKVRALVVVSRADVAWIWDDDEFNQEDADARTEVCMGEELHG